MIQQLRWSEKEGFETAKLDGEHETRLEKKMKRRGTDRFRDVDRGGIFEGEKWSVMNNGRSLGVECFPGLIVDGGLNLPYHGCQDSFVHHMEIFPICCAHNILA